MEKKIYHRQVTKQGVSNRVIDEHTPGQNFARNHVYSLLDPADIKQEKITSSISIDDVNKICGEEDPILCRVLQRQVKWIAMVPFTHESLLIDRKDYRLSENEKEFARHRYALDKQQSIYYMNGRQSSSYDFYSDYYGSLDLGYGFSDSLGGGTITSARSPSQLLQPELLMTPALMKSNLIHSEGRFGGSSNSHESADTCALSLCPAAVSHSAVIANNLQGDQMARKGISGEYSAFVNNSFDGALAKKERLRKAPSCAPPDYNSRSSLSPWGAGNYSEQRLKALRVIEEAKEKEGKRCTPVHFDSSAQNFDRSYQSDDCCIVSVQNEGNMLLATKKKILPQISVQLRSAYDSAETETPSVNGLTGTTLKRTRAPYDLTLPVIDSNLLYMTSSTSADIALIETASIKAGDEIDVILTNRGNRYIRLPSNGTFLAVRKGELDELFINDNHGAASENNFSASANQKTFTISSRSKPPVPSQPTFATTADDLSDTSDNNDIQIIGFTPAKQNCRQKRSRVSETACLSTRLPRLPASLSTTMRKPFIYPSLNNCCGCESALQPKISSTHKICMCSCHKSMLEERRTNRSEARDTTADSQKTCFDVDAAVSVSYGEKS